MFEIRTSWCKQVLFIMAITLLSQAGLWCGEVGVSPEGLVKVESSIFGIAHWDKDWKVTVQKAKPEVLTYLGEGGVQGKGGISRSGSFQLSSGDSFDYTETVNRVSQNDVTFNFELSSAEGIPTQLLVYSTLIPTPMYKNSPAVFNGEKLLVDHNEISKVGEKENTLVLKLKGGSLTIIGSFKISVREHKWGVEVRMKFSKSSGLVLRSELKFNMKYEPYQHTSINLKSIMNMGFTDPVAEDQKGGWTDQGPNNDLSDIKTGRLVMGGIPFEIINPSANNGKSCVAVKGGKRPYYLSQAKVDLPPLSGNYLYLLNSVAWAPVNGVECGKVAVGYEDGTSQKFSLKCGTDTGNFWYPVDLKNALVAWQMQNGSANVGLYSTKIPLNAKKKITSLEFDSAGQVWMVLAATVSNSLHESLTDSTEMIMKPDANWLPCDFDFNTLSGSITDFSFLTDAPAGKYGFLKITENGNFEFEKRSGENVRFWGTNICFDTQFMPEDRTIRMLDDIRAMGYNSIRLHHFGYRLMLNGVMDPVYLRKLDFLVAQAQKRGIYITLDLFTYRVVKDVVAFSNLTPNEYKTLCYFDESTYQNLLTFSKELFGHRNEFTGKLWKEDPVIALLNLVNEGTLTVTTKRMSARVKAVVDGKFEEYLKDNKGSSKSRDELFSVFLTEVGKTFFLRLKTDLQQFGIQTPFSDQNFAGTAGNTRAAYDYVDSHLYWGHPAYIGKKAQQLPLYVTSASAISAYAGGINNMFNTRISGKPMTVTEWNYCYPNPYNMEGPFLMAAYSSLQGYNGLWQFAYSHSGKVGDKLPLRSFDTECNPVTKMALRAGALLYLRKDVKEAETIVSKLELKAKSISLSRIGLILKTGLVYNEKKAVRGTVAILSNETVAKEKEDPEIIIAADQNDAIQKLLKQGIIKSDQIDLARGIVKSETGELSLFAKENVFKVTTHCSEVLILPEKQSANGNFMTVRNDLSFAAFFAGALDGKPLKQSRRIVIFHLTDIKTEKAVFKDRSMSILENFGSEGKYLIRRGKAVMSLEHPFAKHLYACNSSGKRLQEIPLKRIGGNIEITLDTAAIENGAYVYELTD